MPSVSGLPAVQGNTSLVLGEGAPDPPRQSQPSPGHPSLPTGRWLWRGCGVPGQGEEGSRCAEVPGRGTGRSQAGDRNEGEEAEGQRQAEGSAGQQGAGWGAAL